jgi:GDP-D-mannose dehydratase
MSNTQMFVIKRNGTQQPMKYDNITDRMNKLVKPKEFGKVDTARITQKVIQNIINGFSISLTDKTSKSYVDNAVKAVSGIDAEQIVVLTNLQGDSSKARKILNWKPKITIDQLISEMIESDYDKIKKEII